MELILTGALGYMVGIQGRTAEAEELVAGARRSRSRWTRRPGSFRVLLAFKLAWLSEPGSAERNLRPVYEGLKGLGEQSHFCSVSPRCSLRRRTSRGATTRPTNCHARRSDRVARTTSTLTSSGAGCERRSWRIAGTSTSAETLAREAVEYAEASDFLHSHANALSDLAEVLALGRTDCGIRRGDRGGDPSARGQGQRGRRRPHPKTLGRPATGQKAEGHAERAGLRARPRGASSAQEAWFRRSRPASARAASIQRLRRVPAGAA